MIEEYAIEIHSVTKIYRMGKSDFQALNNVSLKIKKGEFVARKGDAFYFKTGTEHIAKNMGDTVLKMIVVELTQ